MKQDLDTINRRAFIGLATAAGATMVHTTAGAATQSNNPHNPTSTMNLNSIAGTCQGSGQAPKYNLNTEGRLELRESGDLYTHQDGMLGFSKLQPEQVDQFDAFLETGCYDVSAESIPMRVPSSIVGRRPGFGNPNGEFPMQHGTNIRFKTNGIRIGAPNLGANKKSWTDLRMSLPLVSHIGLYRDPLQARSREIGEGAAIWLDMMHDSTTITEVRIAVSTYGVLSTCFTDTIRINSLHTADVDFPVYFAGPDDSSLPGHEPQHWANSLNDCCFADGDGPCVIKASTGFNEFGGWQFNNVHIVRQGRKKGIGPESCNLYWTSNGGRIQGGINKDPGHMLILSDGGEYIRKSGRIDADGMILGGSLNVIDTAFMGASGQGRANLRLLPGANKNIIRSTFGGTRHGAVDLLIPKGCESNVVYCDPGMTIIDQGSNTQFICKEVANIQSA